MFLPRLRARGLCASLGVLLPNTHGLGDLLNDLGRKRKAKMGCAGERGIRVATCELWYECVYSSHLLPRIVHNRTEAPLMLTS